MKKVRNILLMAMMTFAAVSAEPMTLSMNRTMRVKKGQSVQIPLSCNNNVGKVSYQAKGLPNGLTLDANGSIIGSISVTSGNFPVLVSGTDQAGNTASQIIVISLDGSSITGGISSPSSLTLGALDSARLNPTGSTISTTIPTTTTSSISNGRATTTININTSSSQNPNFTINPNGDRDNSFNNPNNINNLNNPNSFNVNNPNNANNLSNPNNSNRLNNILGNLGIPPTVQTSQPQNNNPSSNNPNSNNPNSNNNNPNSNNNNPSFNNPSSNNPFSNNPNQNNQNPNNPNNPNISFTSTSFVTSNQPINSNPTSSTDNFIYRTNTYPTGRNPNSVPNTTPNRIFTTNAATNNIPNNPISRDDVRRTAIFERQLNANKAIANLLDVIQQRRANINDVKEKIPKLQAELDQTIKKQRTIQVQITTAENDKKKIQDAIANLKKAINDAKNQLTVLRVNQQSTNNDRLQKEAELAQLRANLENAKNQKAKKQDLLNSLKNDLAKNIQDQATATNQINQLTKKLETTRNILNNIKANISDATDELDGRQKEVTRLQNLLLQAKKNVRDAEQRLNDLQNLKATGPQQLSAIETKISQKTTTVINPLKNQQTAIQNTIKQTKNSIADLGTLISATDGNIGGLGGKISSSNQNLSVTVTVIQNKQADIQQALNDLRILENQLPNFTNKLQVKYNAGNDINSKVIDNKDNLNALLFRLQNESQELINFTKQLEIARAEKEAADLAMQALLQEKSDALPYAVLGGRSSSANLALNRDEANNSISGGDFYSFDFFNSSLGSNDFSCNRDSGFETIEGIIQKIYGNSLTVQGNNGGNYTVNVGSCSGLYSNRQGYKLKVGDKIKVSGNGYGSGYGRQINLIKGTCN